MNTILLANVLCFMVQMQVTAMMTLSRSNLVLHVDSLNGNDSIECLGGGKPCRHLEYISKELNSENDLHKHCSNLTIFIDSPTLKVNSTAKFESCNGITILSGVSNSSTANISCSVSDSCISPNFSPPYENWGKRQNHHNTRDWHCVPLYPYTNCTRSSVGLIFENVSSLNISNVTITDCGAYHVTNDTGAVNLSAAVHVQNCLNVSLEHVTFDGSAGTGLALFNTYGNVSIRHVRFLHNIHSVQHSFVGGIHIKFSGPPSSPAQLPAFYSFESCFFYNNSAPCYVEYDPKLMSKLSDWEDYGLGGAMSMLFAKGSQNIHVSLKDCVFRNNSAPWGAGLHIQFQDEYVDTNIVTVNHSRFDSNFGYIAGGGALIGYNKHSSAKQVNKVIFNTTVFKSNKARYGGGTAVFALFSEYKSQPGDSMLFDNCTWSENFAFYSPAVDVSPYRPDQLSTGFLPIPVFKDCHIEWNHLQYRDANNGTGYVTSGVFVVSRFTVEFWGKNTFINNMFTALLLNSARAVFKSGSIVLFQNNIGILGGAIAMYGFSVLLLSDGVEFTFENNKAYENGGGIYYHSNEQRDFLEGSSCFLDYIGSKENDTDITFHFENNSAHHGGSSIFSVSFYSCFYHYYGNLAKHSLSDFFKKIGTFTFNDMQDERHLATVGMKFSFDDSTMPIHAYPGYPVFVNLTLEDEFNSIVYTELTVAVPKYRTGQNISVHDNFTSDSKMVVHGHPGDNGTVLLSTYGSIREVYYDINVTLLQCPPGYFYSDKSKSCKCSADESSQNYVGIIRCNDTALRAFIRHSFWVGYYNHERGDNSIGNPDYLYTSYCPLEFCTLNYVNYKFHLLPSSSKELNSAVCMKHRHGVVCGQCMENYAVFYHSRHFKCDNETHCQFGMLFYTLSELFPMFILFAIVITFNVSFTTGNVTGLILFSQLIDKLTIDYKHFKDDRRAKFGPLNTLRDLYLIIYGIFDFEFFSIDHLSFCLWKKATVMDILVFKYITTVTAFLLVISLIGLLNTKFCLRFCNGKKKGHQHPKISVQKSIIHGLSAFLIMCYAQCTNITFHILTKVDLSGNSHANPQETTMTYYGGMPYFGKQHLKYAIPALLVLMTIVLVPPILLLINPLLLNLLGFCGLSEHPVVTCTLRTLRFHRLMPLFDCFQSTFKDNMRFFAGLFFVYRIAILGVYAFSQGPLAFYSISELFLCLMLGATAIAQPHKERAHNILDALLVLNLVVINGLTMFATFEETKCDAESETNIGGRAQDFILVGYIQIVLVYAPILCVVCYWVYKRFKQQSRSVGGYQEDDEDDDNRELLFDSDRSGNYGATNAQD